MAPGTQRHAAATRSESGSGGGARAAGLLMSLLLGLGGVACASSWGARQPAREPPAAIVETRGPPPGVDIDIVVEDAPEGLWQARLLLDGVGATELGPASAAARLTIPFGSHSLELHIETYRIDTVTTMQTQTVMVSQTQMVPCSGYNYSLLCSRTVQVPQTRTVPVTTTRRVQTGECTAPGELQVAFVEPRVIALRLDPDGCAVRDASLLADPLAAAPP